MYHVVWGSSLQTVEVKINIDEVSKSILFMHSNFILFAAGFRFFPPFIFVCVWNVNTFNWLSVISFDALGFFFSGRRSIETETDACWQWAERRADRYKWKWHMKIYLVKINSILCSQQSRGTQTIADRNQTASVWNYVYVRITAVLDPIRAQLE